MNIQFKKGVLELLVLSLLNRKDCYGFELVSEISREIDMSEGTIYPLLKRLRDEGYLQTYLVESPGGPPRKYCKLTVQGRHYAAQQIEEWYVFTQRVDNILGGTER